MHKVTLANGTRVKDHWLKWMRTLAYALMCVSGVLLLLSPVLTTAYTEVAEVMSWFLLVGGLCCTIGAVTEKWWGEYVGLPLLASSFMVFGLISSSDAWGAAPYLAAANLALLFAVALGLLARWRDARAVYRLASRLAEKEAASDE